jgi:hypothetical protein
MNYKKVSLSLSLSFVLLFSVAFSPVNATTSETTTTNENTTTSETTTTDASNTNQEYQIDTVQSLEQEVEEINNDSDLIDNETTYENLVENTEPEVLEAYTDQLENEISAAINQVTEEGAVLDTDGNDVITNTVDLSDGGVVEVEQALVVEEQPTDIQPLASDYLYFMGTKTYYEATIAIKHILYPSTKLVLKTGFSINSKGIKAEYASKAGTFAAFPNTVSGSATITDSSAYVVGQDINAQGDYDYAAVGIGGQGIFNSSHTLISTVKLLKLSSKSATVRVSFIHLK